MLVSIVAFEDTGEAQLLRLMLEQLGAVVHLHRPGGPSQIFEGFSVFGQTPDVAIVSAHADQQGFVFPAMAPGVDPLVLKGDRLDAALLEKHLPPLPQTVISTACLTGTPPFARAMFAHGARTYVAPPGYPDGAAVPVLLSLAFYRVLHGGAPWHSAIRAANMIFTLENSLETFIR